METSIGFVKPDPTIKARLREELDQFKLTVKQLSSKTGIPVGTINNITIEDREGAVRAENLRALLEAFPTLDMKYILTGVREQKGNTLSVESLRKAVVLINDAINASK